MPNLREWTAEEDQALLAAVKAGEEQGKKSLRQIFAEFGSHYQRSISACFGRYYALTGRKSNAPSSIRRPKKAKVTKVQVAMSLKAAFKQAAEAAGGRLTAGAIEKIAQKHGVPYHHALSVWGMMHAGGEVFALEREDLLRRVQELTQQHAMLLEEHKRVLERLSELEAIKDRASKMEEVFDKLRAALK